MIIKEIKTWESVEKVYTITYCSDERLSDELDYCRQLGNKKYIKCAVFDSSFITDSRYAAALIPERGMINGNGILPKRITVSRN